jgi:hypothetical protein
MPWTEKDVDSHKKGLSDKGKKQWTRIANSVLKRLMEKGTAEEDAAIEAIKQANGVVNVNASDNQYSVYKNKQKLDYDVKLTTHQDKAHMVIPVVMMVEGVWAGSMGPILHSIEELGKFPAAWNGIPVIIYHAYDEDGNPISANSPDIIDHVCVGKVYNTVVDGKKLKAEVWLDEDKLNVISEKTLSDINETKEIEVSLGMYADYEEEEGKYNGKKYSMIAYNHRPDHLAILPDQIGACSCEDGCGLGVNEEFTAEKWLALRKREKWLSSFTIHEITNNVEQEYRQRINMAYDALRTLDIHVYNYLEELYEDYLIYSQSGKETTKLYKQSYKIESGKVEFVGEPVEVHKSVAYVVNQKGLTRTKFSINNKKEDKMPKNECPKCLVKINAVIANKESGFVEADREWLETLSETALDKAITPKVVEKEKVVERTVEVNKLSSEDQADLAWAKAERKAKRDSMIFGIQTNTSKDLWPDAEFVSMSDAQIERVYKSVKKEEMVNYSLQGDPILVQRKVNGEKPMAPTGVKFKETKQ